MKRSPLRQVRQGISKQMLCDRCKGRDLAELGNSDADGIREVTDGGSHNAALQGGRAHMLARKGRRLACN